MTNLPVVAILLASAGVAMALFFEVSRPETAIPAALLEGGSTLVQPVQPCVQPA